MTRFHISKNGSPAICKAKEGKCPLGGKDAHYLSWAEAQMAADKMNEQEHGIIPGMKKEEKSPSIIEKKYKKAKTAEDFKKIEKRKKELEDDDPNGTNYISRCSSSSKLERFKPAKSKTTYHFKKDRTDKNKGIVRLFGEGELVGFYRVNQRVLNRNKIQIIEIRDTGQIKIYDNKTHRLVTTLMAHPERIEVMLLRANEISSSKWLDKIKENKIKAKEKELD